MEDYLLRFILLLACSVLILSVYSLGSQVYYQTDIDHYIKRNGCIKTDSLDQTRTKLVFVDKEPLFVAGKVEFAYVCNDSTIIWR